MLRQYVGLLFRIPIYKVLLRRSQSPLILFRNGDSLTLSCGLELCKTFSRKAVIKGSATIVEASAYSRDDTDFVCCILRDRSDNYTVLNYSLKDDMCDHHSVRITKVADARDSTDADVSVKGCCIVAGASENPSICFTWSDAYIGMYDVVKNCWKLKYYPLCIQRTLESTLVCLQRNLILFHGKYDNTYEPGVNESYTVTIHKSLPKHWGYGHLRLKPFSRLTRAYDCGQHVVLVEPARVTVWSITITGRERRPCFLNDTERLMRNMRAEEFLPIFGDPKKYNHFRPYWRT